MIKFRLALSILGLPGALLAGGLGATALLSLSMIGLIFIACTALYGIFVYDTIILLKKR
jgi:hypothetical protein